MTINSGRDEERRRGRRRRRRRRRRRKGLGKISPGDVRREERR